MIEVEHVDHADGGVMVEVDKLANAEV